MKKIFLYSVIIFFVFLFSVFVALSVMGASAADLKDMFRSWESIGFVLLIGIPIWGSMFIAILLVSILIKFINKKMNI